jgi:DNA-directed RNA polymerase subunit RPC12/RpoP
MKSQLKRFKCPECKAAFDDPMISRVYLGCPKCGQPLLMLEMERFESIEALERWWNTHEELIWRILARWVRYQIRGVKMYTLSESDPWTDEPARTWDEVQSLRETKGEAFRFGYGGYTPRTFMNDMRAQVAAVFNSDAPV